MTIKYCSVIEYDIIKIPTDDKVIKTHNIGGRFSEPNKRLIESAKSGDIYIFKNITRRCPSNPVQKGGLLMFEIQ